MPHHALAVDDSLARRNEPSSYAATGSVATSAARRELFKSGIRFAFTITRQHEVPALSTRDACEPRSPNWRCVGTTIAWDAIFLPLRRLRFKAEAIAVILQVHFRSGGSRSAPADRRS